MNDAELRQWAVAQVIAHHKGSGVTIPAIIAEAEQLIAFVKGENK